MIYADNAATTKLDPDAFEAMKPYLLEEYGNASQPYSFSRAPKKAIQEARETIASCIHALPDEIYFTSCGTESDNWAIKGAALSRGERSEILTSQIEHHAVLNACAAMEKQGCSVGVLPVDGDGTVREETLEERISEKTRLVSVMMANNEIGTIEPIGKLAAIAHAKGALFHTDAVQALGHVPVDVEELNVDMLSASAHKFNGPKGIGFFFLRRGTSFPPFVDGGAQERRMRAGTENVASIVGMAVALKKNCEQMEENEKHLRDLERRLLSVLDEAGIDYRRNGDSFRHIPGNLSLSFNGRSGEAMLHRLDLMGICVSTGSACDSQNTQISHVLKAIGLTEIYALGTIRVSLGKYNTAEDVEKIGKAILKL